MTITERARNHIVDILTHVFEQKPNTPMLVVFDDDSELARVLTAGYRDAAPYATFIDFAKTSQEDILARFESLPAGALVVLVQSTSFRLNEFRIRVELFKRGLKVIEHPHLGRMTGVEMDVYVDALAYDPVYYRGVGHALKVRIDHASSVVLESDGLELSYRTQFEDAKLNIGDYSGMKNVGSQFPIGEVFTEPKDFTGVNGRVKIFAFGDSNFRVNVPAAPITLVIEQSKIVALVDSTPEFDRVIEQIKADEEVWVRELGFGMNRGFTRDRRVSDIGTYERMCGIHLSLGAKHAIYAKPDLKRRTGRHHVDVFVAIDRVRMDDEVVFERNRGYCVDS